MGRSRLRSRSWFITATVVLVISILIALLFLRDHPLRIFDRMPIRNNDIVFLGDSHIEYFPAAEMLNDRRIRNRGIGGETAADLLLRVEDVMKAGPKKVVLLVGANDAFQGRHLADYLSDMRTLIERIRRHTGTLIILSIPPSRDATIQERIAAFNEALAGLCEDRNIEYIDLDPVLKKNDLLDPSLTTDGVHLNENGYRSILPEVKQAIKG